MTQFNQLNMDMLDLKKINQGLKEQKQELFEKMDNASEVMSRKNLICFCLTMLYFKTISPIVIILYSRSHTECFLENVTIFSNSKDN